MQRAAAAPGDPQSYPAAPDVFIEQRDGGLVAACFFAMASPCELLLDTGDLEQAQRIGLVAAGEAARIEAKFSRYRSDSVVSAINRSAGTRSDPSNFQARRRTPLVMSKRPDARS